MTFPLTTAYIYSILRPLAGAVKSLVVIGVVAYGFLFALPAEAFISGTLYTDAGVTTAPAGITIGIAVGTSTPSVHTVTTSAGGVWSLTGVATSSLASTTPITVWLDASSTDATTMVMGYIGSDITGVPLYYNRVVSRGVGTGSQVQSNWFGFYDFDNDADILLVTATSATSTTILADFINNQGTFIALTSTLVFTGSFQNDATFNNNFGTQRFTGSSETLSGTLTDTSLLGRVVIAGSYTASVGASTTELFIESGGSFTAPSTYLTVAGQFSNEGTFTNNSGTVYMDGVRTEVARYLVGRDSIGATGAGNVQMNALAANGTILYVGKNGDASACNNTTGTGCELMVFDISSTTNPVYVAGRDSSGVEGTGPGGGVSIQALAVAGRYLYVGKGGFASFSCSPTVGSAGARDCELMVFDISSSTNPIYVDGRDSSGGATGGTAIGINTLAVSGNTLYAGLTGTGAVACSQTASTTGASNCELQVYDISSSTNPTYVAGRDSSGGAASTTAITYNKLIASGNVLYVAKAGGTTACSQTVGTIGASHCELQVYNIASTTNPIYAGGRDASGAAAGAGTGNVTMNDIALSGNRLYVGKSGDATACSQAVGSALGCELMVFDVSSTTGPTYVGGRDVSASDIGVQNLAVDSVLVFGNVLYVSKVGSATACSQVPGSAVGCELMVFDVSSTSNPLYLRGLDANASPTTTQSQALTNLVVGNGALFITKANNTTTCSAVPGGALGCELLVLQHSPKANMTGTLTGASALSALMLSGSVTMTANASTTDFTVLTNATATPPRRLSVSGHYINNGVTTYLPSISDVVFSGGAAQSVTGNLSATSALPSVTFTGAGTKTINNPLTITGNFSNQSTFDANNQSLEIRSQVIEYLTSRDAGGTVGGAVNAQINTFVASGTILYIGKNGDAGTCSNTTGTGCELMVFDISSTTNPVYVAGRDSSGTEGTGPGGTVGVQALHVSTNASGTFLYVGKAGGATACSQTAGSAGARDCELMVFTISSSTNPVYVRGIDSAGDIGGRAAVGINTLVVASSTLYTGLTGTGAVACSGTASTTGASNCELQVYNISSSTNPTYVTGRDSAGQVGSTTAITVNKLLVSSSTLYVAKAGGTTVCSQTLGTIGASHCELQVYDVSSSTNPIYAGGRDASGAAAGSVAGTGNVTMNDIALSGNRLYVGKNGDATACAQTVAGGLGCELMVYDISSSTGPTYVGGRDVDGSETGLISVAADSVVVSAQTLYMSKAGSATPCSLVIGLASGCELMVFDISSTSQPVYIAGRDMGGTDSGIQNQTVANIVIADTGTLYLGKVNSATGCQQSVNNLTGCELLAFQVASNLSGTLTNTSSLGTTTVTGMANFRSNASTTNLTISASSTVGAPAILSISNTFNNGGGMFVANAGRVVLDGAGSQSLLSTGTTTFHALSKVVTASSTLTFTASSTYLFTGPITLAGTSTNQRLSLRSTISGVRFNLTPLATTTVSRLDVQDANNTSATITCSVRCVDSGNNSGWNLLAVLTDLLISGSLFSGEGATPVLSSKTIALAIGTSTVSTYTTTSDGWGAYEFTIPGISGIPTSTPVLVWVDNDVNFRGAHFTKASSTYATSISDLDVYRDHVIVGTEADVVSDIVVDAEMFFYDNDDDSDIPYNATFPTGVVISPGNKLYLQPTKAFLQFYPLTVLGSASATSTDGSLHLPDTTIFISSATTTIGGNFYASSTASYLQLESELVFNATTTGKVITGGVLGGGLSRIRFSGVDGEWTFTDPASTTRVTIEQGTVINPTNLTIAGNFSNTGTIINSGTLYFTGASSIAGELTGASALGNVTVDNAASYGWVERSTDEMAAWTDVAFSEGKFVAVNSASGFVLTSSDGREWNGREIPEANIWRAVTYGNGRFVAVAEDGLNQVMYSDDGVTWIAASSSVQLAWSSVTYGEGLFVAVSSDGANRVMTSPDGATWTTRTAAFDSTWYDVTYGNGRFVAVALGSALGVAGNVMYSDNGTNWFTATSSEDLAYVDVEYGEGLFVAVSIVGAGNQIMTSPDGITWTTRTTPTPTREYFAIAYGNGTFIAIASTTNNVLYSDDGLEWYVLDNGIQAATWFGLAFGEGTFVAVAADAETQIMTSQYGGEVTVLDDAEMSDLTIETGSVFVAPDSALTIAGTFTNTSGEFDDNGGTLYLAGTGEALAGTFTGDSELGTVRVTGSYTAPANASTTSLIIEAGGEFTAPSNILSVTGTFRNDGVFDNNGGALYVEGSEGEALGYLGGQDSGGSDGVFAITSVGTTLYVGKEGNSGTCSATDRTGCELMVFDISSTTNPVYVGGQQGAGVSDTTTATINALVATGTTLYVGKSGNSGTCSSVNRTGCELMVFDISSTTNPVFVDGEDSTTGAGTRSVDELYLYKTVLYVAKAGDTGTCSATVRTGCELMIFTVSSTTDPKYVSGRDSGTGLGTSQIIAFTETDGYLYVGRAGDSGTCSAANSTGCELVIYTLASTTGPIQVGQLNFGIDAIFKMAVKDSYLYITKDLDFLDLPCLEVSVAGCSFAVFDITSTTNPVFVVSKAISGAGGVAAVGSAVYFGNADIISSDCNNSYWYYCGVLAVDMSSTTDPLIVGKQKTAIDVSATVYALHFVGDVVYVGRSDTTTTCSAAERNGCELLVLNAGVNTAVAGNLTGTHDLSDVLVGGQVEFFDPASSTNLTVTNQATALLSSDVSISGNLVNDDELIVNSEATLTFAGTSQTISGTPSNGSFYSDVILSGSGTKTFTSNATTSNLTIGSGVTMSAPARVTISGDFLNNGTLSSNGGQIESGSQLSFLSAQDAAGGVGTTSSIQIEAVAFDGAMLYVGKAGSATPCSQTSGSAAGCELLVFDVSSSTNPIFIAGRDASGNATGTANATVNDLLVIGDYLYIAKAGDSTNCTNTVGSANGCELQVYDISSSTNPVYSGGRDQRGGNNGNSSDNGSSQLNALAVVGSYLFVGGAAAVGTCDNTGSTGDINGPCELKVFDISSSTNPSLRDSVDVTSSAAAAAVQALSIESGMLYVGKAGNATACSDSFVNTGQGHGCELIVFNLASSTSFSYVRGLDSSGSATGTGATAINSLDVERGVLYAGKAASVTNCAQTIGSGVGCELMVFDVGSTSNPVYVAGRDASGGRSGIQSLGINDVLAVGNALFVAKDGNSTTCLPLGGAAVGCEFMMFDTASSTNPSLRLLLDSSGIVASTSAVAVRDLALSGALMTAARAGSAVSCVSAAGSAGGCELMLLDAGTNFSGFLTESSALASVSVLGPATFNHTASTTNLAIISGSLRAPAHLSIEGNYTQSGSFNAATGTIYMSGLSQQTATGTMMGQNAFHDLIVKNTSGNGTTTQAVVFGAPIETTGTFSMGASTSARFLASATNTFEAVNWTGTAGSPVWLRSSVDGTQWRFVTDSFVSTSHVNVRDSLNGSSTVPCTTSCIDVGNNTNWNFATIAAPGSLTLTEHPSGQADNLFSFQNQDDSLLYRFAMTAATETAIVDDVALSLFGLRGVDISKVTDIRLYQDVNSDGLLDGGDTQVLGAGIMAIDGEAGTITFSSGTTSVATTSVQRYIVTADTVAINNNNWMNVQLRSTGVVATGLTSGSPTTIVGNVSPVQHIRSSQGGGVSRQAIGGDAPAGAGVQGGGGQGGGQTSNESGQGADGANIAPDPDFFRPTQTGDVYDEWTDPSFAYQSDGDSAQGTAGKRQNYGGFGFAIPGSNTIQGIQVKLDASATTPAGTIQVGLSWDGGFSVTTLEATPTLTASDVVYTLGGVSNTWGRSWTPTEFNNTNFRVRVLGFDESNTVLLDAIEVRVYHTAGGGGGGGGGGAI
jgi:hypothetical protein